jgi:iron complex transport system substrate-binding protein
MKWTTLAASVAAVVLVAACGDDSPTSGGSTPATGGAVATTPTVAAPTTPAPQPVSRIASLSPTATEMLFAIGAGDQVVAVDDLSDYPPAAVDKPHDLSAVQPDLVVIGDDPTGLTQQLEAAGLTVWSGPPATSLDNVYEQIEQLGTLTGHVAEAAALVTSMQTGIDAAIKAAPQSATPLTYYHEVDNNLRSITENTLIGQIYALFGMQSIADFQEVDSDNPQLSADAIIDSDPDFIFLADGESLEALAARPGWASLKAVTNGNVVVIDGDIASRWGPRLVDFAGAVSAALSA